MLFKHTLRGTSAAFSAVVLSQILIFSRAHFSPFACLMGPKTIHVSVKTHADIKV